MSVLEPFVEKSQAEARRKGMVQCLKCSTEFHKGEAKRRVHKKQRKSATQNGVGSQDNSSSGKLDLCCFHIYTREIPEPAPFLFQHGA